MVPALILLATPLFSDAHHKEHPTASTHSTLNRATSPTTDGLQLKAIIRAQPAHP